MTSVDEALLELKRQDREAENRRFALQKAVDLTAPHCAHWTTEQTKAAGGTIVELAGKFAGFLNGDASPAKP